ncbi:FtsB family cell division protein [Pseudonocardia sichuanensis]|uniref:Septum formation initiator n=1 Tax=Pseudonocardia kunmingensis TaxID=630975 RepID=A0A543D9C9_9PSEU|nr:septum formation initiator family protein [Pseudonocardia kunmingensis]TQM05895.1 septum formation initiator [Pseudonocardia kunmingensis]
MGDERAKARGERTRRTPRPRRSGTGASRRRNREPRLTRVPRARGVVAATTGLLGLSSTKRAAILALVVCALALTVAVPLRNYVAQRQELAAVSEQQQALAAEVAELTRERARLSDPAEIEAQARSRLGYVMPGEVPYVVQLPAAPEPAPATGADAGVPWYHVLWREVTEGPR